MPGHADRPDRKARSGRLSTRCPARAGSALTALPLRVGAVHHDRPAATADHHRTRLLLQRTQRATYLHLCLLGASGSEYRNATPTAGIPRPASVEPLPSRRPYQWAEVILMPVRRLLAAVLVAAATVPLAATPAAAHGAPTDPISRAAACGPEGGTRPRAPLPGRDRGGRGGPRMGQRAAFRDQRARPGTDPGR